MFRISSPRKALCEASRLRRNFVLDQRFGGFAGGFQKSRHDGATWVVNTDYDVMPQIFEGQIRPDDVLVDLGCGRGRVINWWLNQGYRNPIVGLEIVPEVADWTRRRLRNWSNVSILACDAIDKLPAEGTLFYLFNPFADEASTRRFMARFEQLFANKPGVRALYYNPVFSELFEQSPAWCVAYRNIAVPGHSPHVAGHTRLCQLSLFSEGADADERS